MSILERILCRLGFHGKLEATNETWALMWGYKTMSSGWYRRCTTCGRNVK